MFHFVPLPHLLALCLIGILLTLGYYSFGLFLGSLIIAHIHAIVHTIIVAPINVGHIIQVYLILYVIQIDGVNTDIRSVCVRWVILYCAVYVLQNHIYVLLYISK